VGGAQLPDLRFDALAVRRYPCIGMNHGMIRPYILHLKTPFFSRAFFMCRILADRVKTHDDFRAGIPFSPAAQ
jgi:hypothetical protein